MLIYRRCYIQISKANPFGIGFSRIAGGVESFRRLSSIKFDVRTTLGWDATTNTSSKTQYRQSDVYVFCLLHHQDKSSVDPLDLSQWTFNVISTRRLDESLLTQKTLSLVTLLKLQPRLCGFTDLRNAINIEAAIDNRA